MPDLDRAHELIESGATLHEIALACDTKLQAYTLYAQAMQARFGPNRIAGARECEICGQRPPAGDGEVTWRAVTHDQKAVSHAFIALLLGHFSTAGRITVKFSTHHPCCDSCRRGLWWRVWLTRAGKVLLFLPIVLAILATLFGLLDLAVLLFTPSDKSLFRGAFVFLAESLATLALLYFGYRWLSAASVPHALRVLSRPPFEPIRVRRA